MNEETKGEENKNEEENPENLPDSPQDMEGESQDEVCSVMADDNTAACEASSVPNYLRRAEEFIVANLTDPPSLDKIAQRANVSVSTLRALLRLDTASVPCRS